MPRSRRNPPGGFVYHVLNRANRREMLFERASDYEAFVRVILETLLRHTMRILHYCLMPNHWHFVMWPAEDQQLAKFMHFLTTTHATRWNGAHGLTGTGHVYQGPYKYFPVEEDGHYYNVGRYAVRNALRAGLVGRAEDWPWCSLATHNPIPLSEGPLPVGSQWLEWVNEPQSEAELAALRRSVVRGCPYGNDDWSRRIADELGIQHTLRKRGRPYGLSL